MKIWIASLFAMSAMGLMAQAPTTPAPAAHAPSGPGLTLTTTAFTDGGIIPDKYTMAVTGDAVSPALAWDHVPDGTVSFVLTVRDPDTSVKRKTDEVLHWLFFNIPATARALPEGIPAEAQRPDGAIQALNQKNKVGYMGMGAPAVGPYHHYLFALYALDTKLDLGPDATLPDVQNAMQGHILGKGVLIGLFHMP
jgi:Raf kinase inhibitor-like YbhB/YbcL family protein